MNIFLFLYTFFRKYIFRLFYSLSQNYIYRHIKVCITLITWKLADRIRTYAFHVYMYTYIMLYNRHGRRMYLRWSARVAQFLVNQACQFSHFWLTGCTLQQRTVIGCQPHCATSQLHSRRMHFNTSS